MGDSSACLVQSLSPPSPNSPEVKVGDPLHALTTSVSFGRFMSETLAWEKWSSFTHNRYLEEAEKSSKPGSVAAKKAYFEAHYKRIAAKKAAALLEEVNAEADDSFDPNMGNEVFRNSLICSEVQSAGSLAIDEAGEEKEVESSGLVSPGDANGHDLTAQQTDLRVVLMEITEPKPEHLTIANNSVQVEVPNNLETVDNQSRIISSQDKKPVKNAARVEDSAALNKKEYFISSSKLSSNSGATKFQGPHKSTSPVQLKSEKSGTPSNKKFARNSIEKRRANLNSLHISINFTSRVDETSKISSMSQKTGNSRSVRMFDKASKDFSDKQMPNRVHTLPSCLQASVSGVSRHPTVITQPEKRSHLESSSSRGRKARPPTVCSSFNFKCEERVAKRKEFFEKLKTKEEEKLQLRAKSKEKVENDFKKMRQSVALKDRPGENLHCKREFPVNPMKKILTAWPCSPKLQNPSRIRDAGSRHHLEPLAKTDYSKHVTEKNLKPVHSTNAQAKKNVCENASPNIQN